MENIHDLACKAISADQSKQTYAIQSMQTCADQSKQTYADWPHSIRSCGFLQELATDLRHRDVCMGVASIYFAVLASAIVNLEDRLATCKGKQ